MALIMGLLQTHDKTEQMIILIIFVSFKKGMILIMQYDHELIMDKWWFWSWDYKNNNLFDHIWNRENFDDETISMNFY